MPSFDVQIPPEGIMSELHFVGSFTLAGYAHLSWNRSCISLLVCWSDWLMMSPSSNAYQVRNRYDSIYSFTLFMCRLIIEHCLFFMESYRAYTLKFNLFSESSLQRDSVLFFFRSLYISYPSTSSLIHWV